MSWFDTAGIASFAKSALTTAQKTIDKALDIQEEKASKSEQKKSNTPHPQTEADFFETFGLSDKPSTASEPVVKSSNLNKLKGVQNLIPSSSSQESEAHGSGFWSDTWGSFFEAKPQDISEEKFDKSTKCEDTVAENIKKERKDGTVLSQPQKASLFPSDTNVIQTTNQISRDSDNDSKSDSSKTLEQVEIKSSHLLSSDEHINQISTKIEIPENIPSDNDINNCSKENELLSQILTESSITSNENSNNNDNSSSVVTVQPCSESNLITKDISDQLESDTLNAQVETDISSVVPYSQDSACDIPLNESNANRSLNQAIDSSNETKVSSLSHPVSKTNNKMEDSAFLTLHLPTPAEKSSEKTESEYDVIELAAHVEHETRLEDSYTESPTEAIDSKYDASSSTLIISDLPVTMPENIANWECCALDTITPDLFISDDNETVDGEKSETDINESQTLQMSTSGGSFHVMNVDSFNSNQTWASHSKSLHYITESQNSSNGERNSHHSDGSSNSSKDDDDTDTAEVKEFDAKSCSSNGSHTTSSSFVKCSVDDSNSTRGHSPTSTINSERSDATKQESTSGDENETATSSDIEILSPPNGENGDRNISPLKHIWLPRQVRLRRSESPTSDSSKDSIMPVVSEIDEVCYADESNSSSAIYEDKVERVDDHKNYESSENMCQLLQKQEELQNLLNAREKKLVELSKENIELQENEQRLKNLVQKMRIEQAKESKDITDLTREFTQKLSRVEGQLKDTIKERDSLKVQLEEMKTDLSGRISAADFEEVIAEKDQQIKELTEEGQKLSKKELLHTTIIRKLRAKEEETNKLLKSQKDEIENNSKEVERLRKSISAKEEQEKKHIDAIRELSNSVKRFEKEVSGLKSDLEDSREKEQSFKKSLDSTYKDLTDLRKSYASKEIEVQDLKSGLELQAKENLEQTLENFKKEAAREKEKLLMQMQDLRGSVLHAEDDANLREKMFKTEIASLQKRLQEAEERNEDLTKNMSSATRPLVRQIENLQATFTTQTISWEKIEKNLTDRLSDAQNQVALLTEKERALAERYMECQSKLTALEQQNTSLRLDKLQLTSDLEALRTDLVMIEENKNRENYTVEKLKQNFNAEIKKLKQEKMNLENTMTTCLEQLDAEKRKVAKLEEEIKIKDTKAMILSNVSPCPSPTGSVRSSVSSIHNWSQDESHDTGLHTPINSYRMSVYESLRLGSGSSLLENLQSQLKQREGEINQLQSEISKLEQVKESMTRELVQLSAENEELDRKLAKLESLEKEHKELDQKYNTLLQMYGEKVEETEELQLDLADVKSMYKAQIEELLMKN